MTDSYTIIVCGCIILVRYMQYYIVDFNSNKGVKNGRNYKKENGENDQFRYFQSNRAGPPHF